MKKIILLIITIILFTSCARETFYLEEKYYQEPNIIEIDKIDDLNKLVEDKESFVVFLYLEGCSSCASFKPIIEEYILDNNLTFYSISLKLLEDKKDAISKKVEYAPSIIIFKEGKIIDYLDAQKDSHIKYYKNIEDFASWLESYIKIKQ